MKKLLTAVLCAGLIALTASGCGYNNDALIQANSESAAKENASSEQSATEEVIKDTDYKNDLGGLTDYFIAKGYIQKDEKTVTEMDASAIGAKKGKKFAVVYEGQNVTIELYEYDVENLNDTAKSIISSVEKDGTFSIFDLPAVPAYLSDNGKFLMVYNDKSISKDNPDKTTLNYEHREEVIKDFKAFNK